MSNFKNIQDCWDAIEECKTISSLRKCLNQIPSSFGNWDITTSADDPDLDVTEVLVSNTYFDRDSYSIEEDSIIITLEVHYEVWALGYDRDDYCIDVEEFLASYKNKEEAVEYAKSFKDISYLWNDAENYLEEDDYLEIRVEAVFDDEDHESFNIDTVYTNTIYQSPTFEA